MITGWPLQATANSSWSNIKQSHEEEISRVQSIEWAREVAEAERAHRDRDRDRERKEEEEELSAVCNM